MVIAVDRPRRTVQYGRCGGYHTPRPLHAPGRARATAGRHSRGPSGRLTEQAGGCATGGSAERGRAPSTASAGRAGAEGPTFRRSRGPPTIRQLTAARRELAHRSPTDDERVAANVELAASRTAGAPAAGSRPARATAHVAGTGFEAREERKPFVGLRRKIAERMQRSKQTAAHFTFVEVRRLAQGSARRIPTGCRGTTQLTLLRSSSRRGRGAEAAPDSE